MGTELCDDIRPNGGETTVQRSSAHPVPVLLERHGLVDFQDGNVPRANLILLKLEGLGGRRTCKAWQMVEHRLSFGESRT